MKTTILAFAMVLGLGLSHAPGALAQISSKSGAMVKVERAYETSLALGTSTSITLNFKGPANTALEVRYTTDPGLQLESTSHTVLHTNQDGLASDSPTLRTLAEGRQYLNIFIRQNGQQQAVSVRITVGQGKAAKRQKNTQQLTTPEGQNLIILPSE